LVSHEKLELLSGHGRNRTAVNNIEALHHAKMAPQRKPFGLTHEEKDIRIPPPLARLETLEMKMHKTRRDSGKPPSSDG